MGGHLQDVLTGVPSWTVYALVFLLPFVECSLFVGFLFPAETVLVLAGVLAAGALPGRSSVDVRVLCVLAVAGAVLGDSAGWLVGRRYGPAVQRSRLGRVVGPQRWAAAESFLRRRGGPAVFFGRFTALLRALVPSAAGMSRLPFRTFVVWNAAGGLVWGAGAVLAGYAAGASYHEVERYLGRGALVVTGVVVVAGVAAHLVRRRRHAARPVEAGEPTTSVPSGR